MGIVQAIWSLVGKAVRVSFASEFRQSTSKFRFFGTTGVLTNPF